MLPLWAAAGRHAHRNLGTRQVPLLALGAAFCFSIMMFNIPALGGTTAHPVAGTLLAVLVGPWAAMIGISVALAIQALFFADGGLLAYGANCFTMAFVLPFVGYSIYRLAAGRSTALSSRRMLAAGLGAYLGLNAAAAMVALLLGIQPALFHEPNGHALYFPFGLKVTLPAMLGAHLLIAGPAEAVVTALVVRYLALAGHSLYACRPHRQETSDAPQPHRRRETAWIGLLALVALSPLGLLAKGDAWGEWDTEGLKQQIRNVEGREYVPRGLAQMQGHAYQGVQGLRDYGQPEEGRNNAGYIRAAALGAGTISLLLLFIGRLLANGEEGIHRFHRLRRLQQPWRAAQNREAERTTPKHPDTEHRTPDVEHLNTQTSEHRTPNTGSPLPAWLQTSDPDASTAAGSARPANRYVERTLAEITESAATALYGERWARQSGYLQQLDPRAKLIGFLALIAVAACLRQPATLLGLYGLTLLLAALSHLPLGMLCRRVWLSTPLFVCALALPMVLNVVTPGRAVLTLWHQPYLAMTAPGLASAGLLILRVGVAVSLAALLTMTTGWNELLRALRALFVPRLFLVVLLMTYRYLALLLQTAAEMFVARRSRTVGRQTNADGRRFVGASVGALYSKTLALSEEVHAAMVSRGFNGEMRTLTRLCWNRADSLWTIAVLLIALLTLGGEHARLF
jgi:cobalt/nickel transport system permease protein